MVTQWHLYIESKKDLSNLMVRVNWNREVSGILANSGDGGMQKEMDTDLL